MSDLEKSIRDALNSLAQQHGVTDDAAPDTRTAPRVLPLVRRATPDARRTAIVDTAGRLERADAERRRTAASVEDRAVEGNYAEVEVSRGCVVTVFVLTVERTGFGTRATCKRLDTRQSVRVRLDDLLNLRPEE